MVAWFRFVLRYRRTAEHALNFTRKRYAIGQEYGSEIHYPGESC